MLNRELVQNFGVGGGVHGYEEVIHVPLVVELGGSMIARISAD